MSFSMLRKWRALSGAAIVMLLAGGLVAADRRTPNAHAYTSSVSLTIVASGCTPSTWRGALSNAYTKGYWPAYKVAQSTGAVKHCSTKLRAADSNTKADYYLLDAGSEWSTASSSQFHSGAPWSQTVSSTALARSSEYSGTPSFSRSTCNVSFSIGISFAGISISTPQRFRCGTQVTRTALTVNSAGWKGVDAAKIASTETIYAQAVAEKTVPKYTTTFSRPTYTYSWTRVQQCPRGSCYLGWQPTRQSSQSSTTHTR